MLVVGIACAVDDIGFGVPPINETDSVAVSRTRERRNKAIVTSKYEFYRCGLLVPRFTDFFGAGFAGVGVVAAASDGRGGI